MEWVATLLRDLLSGIEPAAAPWVVTMLAERAYLWTKSGSSVLFG